MAIDLLQMIVVIALIVFLAIPVGRYMATVFTGGHTLLDPVLDPVDNAIYRLSGVDRRGMRWQGYVVAMLLTNLVMFLIQFVILETQQFLPLNPDGQGPINPFLAFNTAASFITNTNWQMAMRGVNYRPSSASDLLRRNIAIYGVGGVIAPFIGIKAIDVILSLLNVVKV